MAFLYVKEKSLVTVSTSVKSFKTFTISSFSLELIISIFLCLSLSVMMELYISRFLDEKSSIPIFLAS